MKTLTLIATLILFTSSVLAQNDGPPPPPDPEPEFYSHGVTFPKPTTAQLDTLLVHGIVPHVLQDEVLRPMYWPRSAFVVAARAGHRMYMTQALDGGFGVEGNIGIPFGHTDHGFYFFARANAYRVIMPDWLGWNVEAGQSGVMFNGGAGMGIAIPLRHPQISFPVAFQMGLAFFQSRGDASADTYLSFDPSLGIRYRLFPALAVLARTQGAWMVSLNPHNRNIGAWNFSIGVEVALALQRTQPLQYWVPPLVVTAQDVVKLLASEVIPPVNIFDRNLDFINTELKPATAFGWYDLGFYGEIRGTIIASSRASSGNVTALDIKVDSADTRGFRVTRTGTFIKPTAVLDLAVPPEVAAAVTDTAALNRIRLGDYAFRSKSDLGTRYLRIEVFPQAKGERELIPKVGSLVTIRGDVRWDGDGHVEVHPRTQKDIQTQTANFLDSDDPVDVE
ncbi:MAG: hypothetical protein H7X80_01345 [bacterium]|nr:hypothetical protein [Candidatus Kapabacteria bacterium]